MKEAVARAVKAPLRDGYKIVELTIKFIELDTRLSVSIFSFPTLWREPR